MLKRAVLFFVVFLWAQLAVAAEWYEGGALHKANALEWQQATEANKLATVSDFVAGIYNRNGFKPEIQAAIKSGGMPAIKVLSEKLVQELNTAFAPESDPEQNRQLFTNQKVADSAVMIMVISGFIGK